MEDADRREKAPEKVTVQCGKPRGCDKFEGSHLDSPPDVCDVSPQVEVTVFSKTAQERTGNGNVRATAKSVTPDGGRIFVMYDIPHLDGKAQLHWKWVLPNAVTPPLEIVGLPEKAAPEISRRAALKGIAVVGGVAALTAAAAAAAVVLSRNK